MARNKKVDPSGTDGFSIAVVRIGCFFLVNRQRAHLVVTVSASDKANFTNVVIDYNSSNCLKR
jgi:hypothetical protein